MKAVKNCVKVWSRDVNPEKAHYFPICSAIVFRRRSEGGVTSEAASRRRHSKKSLHNFFFIGRPDEEREDIKTGAAGEKKANANGWSALLSTRFLSLYHLLLRQMELSKLISISIETNGSLAPIRGYSVT